MSLVFTHVKVRSWLNCNSHLLDVQTSWICHEDYITPGVKNYVNQFAYFIHRYGRGTVYIHEWRGTWACTRKYRNWHPHIAILNWTLNWTLYFKSEYSGWLILAACKLFNSLNKKGRGDDWIICSNAWKKLHDLILTVLEKSSIAETDCCRLVVAWLPHQALGTPSRRIIACLEASCRNRPILLAFLIRGDPIR